MTEAMPFLQKYDITFLRPPPNFGRGFVYPILETGDAKLFSFSLAK